MRRIDLKRIHTAHFGTMRAINRQIVLNYVRDRGPISRAEIARRTKLQRSTVSEIVDSLLEEGLIEEVGSGQSTGGRCPTLLALRTTGAAAIGIDIAPTRTAVATSDLAGGLLESEEFETDHDFERTIARAVAAAGRLIERGGGSLEGIGVSLPGLVDSSKGRLLYGPYFKWQDPDVSGPIAAATGLKVTIDNDANAAALAELWFGRADVSEARDFIMVFIAEGVGAGIIFDGQVYRGEGDRKSTRLNSSHANISYAVFCLKKKTVLSTPNRSLNGAMFICRTCCCTCRRCRAGLVEVYGRSSGMRRTRHESR